MSHSYRHLLLISLALAVAACTDDDGGPQTPPPPRGIVVLNGYAEPGLTLLADTGAASTHVDFDPFDGATLTLENDTVLTTASRGAGSLLYVADARTGDFASIQLPVNSNPGGARFVEQPGLGRVAAVALRDSNSVALVRVSGAGAGGYTLVRDAGQCPTDAFRDASALYVVASNQACTSNYHSFAQAYVTWIADAAPLARETIQLGNSARGSATAIVVRDTAYILTIGTTAFGENIVTPPAVSRVDLRRRQLINTVLIASGVLGNVMHLGADGRLYVSAYASQDFSEQRVYALDPSTMDYRGVRESGKDFLMLRKSNGSAPNCAAATADARSNVYCVEVSSTAAATLYVFDANGTQVRQAPAGLGAVDLALRF